MEEKIDKSMFGSFDLTRTLTKYEIENFDEFMQDENEEINASRVSITRSVNESIELMEKGILPI